MDVGFGSEGQRERERETWKLEGVSTSTPVSIHVPLSFPFDSPLFGAISLYNPILWYLKGLHWRGLN